MRKRSCTVLAFVLMLVLAVPSARADLKRGDSGEEVMTLQERLFDMWYIFEEPDG